MKTLHKLRQLFFLILLTFYTVSSTAQVEYVDQLETVYLSKEKKSTQDFADYNQDLVSTGVIHFKRQIKAAKKNPKLLIHQANSGSFIIVDENYLKMIRKAANNSNSPEAFTYYLQENFSSKVLTKIQIENIEELYFIARRDTFNGKIDELPTIL